MSATVENLNADQALDSHPTAWTADDVAGIRAGPETTIPTITAQDVRPVIHGIDLWDSWPLQTPDGAVARIGGAEFWMALSSSWLPDPEERHHHARLRLLRLRNGSWSDCGYLLPDGFGPGSREWAGSAIYEEGKNKVTLFFTASGRKGELQPTFEQRIFQTSGSFVTSEVRSGIVDWTHPEEAFCADESIYVRVNQTDGEPGKIKAFRDPFFFKDPKDSAEYLLFTGSLKKSRSDYNGAIGVAKAGNAERKTWHLLPPIVTADDVNNELERPQMVVRDGLYYLFWSTQRKTFAHSGPSGPNGLYGMVSDGLFGDYKPLNGTGLVAANPPDEPRQAYSWTVLDSLDVAGFVDYWGLKGKALNGDVERARRQFGGTFAPRFSLRVNGDQAILA